MITAIALLLVAAAIHRIWNYEDIFAPVRRLRWVMALPPLSCPACNPIGIAAVVAVAAHLGGVLTLTQAVIFTFAAYLPLRTLVWVYQQNWSAWFTVPMLLQRGLNAWQATLPVSAKPAVPSPPSLPGKPGCTSCGEKKDAILAERKRTDAFPRRFVVIGESAAHWAAILKETYPAALVQIWGSLSAVQPPAGIEYRAMIPSDAPSDQLAKALLNGLIWLGNATVVTDGWLEDQTKWGAVQEAGKVRAFSWVHLTNGGALVATAPEHHEVAPRTAETLLAAVAKVRPVPAPPAG